MNETEHHSGIDTNKNKILKCSKDFQIGKSRSNLLGQKDMERCAATCQKNILVQHAQKREREGGQ